MAGDLQQNVVAKFTIADFASRGITTIASAAGRANQSFNNLSRTAAGLTGAMGFAAGILSFQGLVATANEHIKAVRTISKVTGLAAERADALATNMALVGLNSEEATGILSSMSKANERVALTMDGLQGGSKRTTQIFQQMGVDISKGPEKAMLQLSAAAEKGKVSAVQLSRGLGINEGQAVDLMGYLRQGPVALKAGLDAAAASGEMITASTLQTVGEMTKLKRESSVTFTRMAVIIGKEILPVAKELLDQFNQSAGKWKGYAKDFGSFLHNNLSTAITLAKQLGKVLIANAVVSKATGSGLGDWGGKILGASMRGGSSGGVLGWAGKGLAGHLGGLAQAGVGKAIDMGASPTAILSGLQGLSKLTPVIEAIGGLARLTGVAVLIGIVVGGVSSLVTNFQGVRTFLGDILDKLAATVAPLSAVAGPVLGELGDFFKLALPLALSTVLTLVQTIAEYTRKTGAFLYEVMQHPIQAAKDIGGTWSRVSAGVDNDIASTLNRQRVERDQAENAAAIKAKAKPPPEREAAPNYDFRGSTFDISQSFASGFDPDRIAVALTRDISNAGERRLTSSLSPAFGPR